MSENPPGASWRLYYPCASSPLLDGLSANALRVYFYLASAGYLKVELSSADGAKIFRVSKASWFRSLRHLEERGFLRRTTEDRDFGRPPRHLLQAMRLELVQR